MLEEVEAERKQAHSCAAPWPWWLKATPASGLDDNETAASVYGDIDVSHAAQDVKQLLLDDPNNLDPAQEEPYRIYKTDPKGEYEKRVKAQAALLRNI